MKTAARSNTNLKLLDNGGYFDKILNQLKYQTYVQNQTKPKRKQNKKDASKEKPKVEQLVTLDIMAAKKQLNEMHTRVTLMGIKSIVWYFNKTMRRAIQSLYIEERSLSKIKQLLSDNKRVILMPIYKSFADAFIHLYIHHHY